MILDTDNFVWEIKQPASIFTMLYLRKSKLEMQYIGAYFDHDCMRLKRVDPSILMFLVLLDCYSVIL